MQYSIVILFSSLTIKIHVFFQEWVNQEHQFKLLKQILLKYIISVKKKEIEKNTFVPLNKNQQILVKGIINKEDQIWSLPTLLKSFTQMTHLFHRGMTGKWVNMIVTFILLMSEF